MLRPGHPVGNVAIGNGKRVQNASYGCVQYQPDCEKTSRKKRPHGQKEAKIEPKTSVIPISFNGFVPLAPRVLRLNQLKFNDLAGMAGMAVFPTSYRHFSGCPLSVYTSAPQIHVESASPCHRHPRALFHNWPRRRLPSRARLQTPAFSRAFHPSTSQIK